MKPAFLVLFVVAAEAQLDLLAEDCSSTDSSRFRGEETYVTQGGADLGSMVKIMDLPAGANVDIKCRYWAGLDAAGGTCNVNIAQFYLCTSLTFCDSVRLRDIDNDRDYNLVAPDTSDTWSVYFDSRTLPPSCFPRTIGAQIVFVINEAETGGGSKEVLAIAIICVTLAVCCIIAVNGRRILLYMEPLLMRQFEVDEKDRLERREKYLARKRAKYGDAYKDNRQPTTPSGSAAGVPPSADGSGSQSGVGGVGGGAGGVGMGGGSGAADAPLYTSAGATTYDPLDTSPLRPSATTFSMNHSPGSPQGYKPVRPPPGTPTYGGRMSVSSPSPFEMDGTPHTPNMDMGDSVASVQSNILRSKLSSSQNELSRVKRELKTANEKALQLSLKLNEEQVGKVALTKKYAAVVERVKEFDERMRDAEQVMKSERQHHKELQKNTEQLKEKLRQSQQASDQQAQLIRKMQKEREDDAKGYRENLDRRSETAEAIRERQTQFVDFFTKLVATSMERLSDDKDSNDVLITVTTSELSSTITEQQQLLQKLALENESMRDSLQFLIREVEDESNTLVLTLLKENKEVWSQLNSCRAELARFRESDRSYSQKLHETRQQDQIDALMQENAKLETRVQKSNDALKVHMEKGRDHERTLQQIMETLQAAEQEKGFLTTQVADFRSSSESLRLQITTLEGELEGERRNKESFESLQSDVAKEKKRHEASKDQHKQELLEIKTEYQRERSKFVEEIKHQHKQLHEATIEADRHQREFTRLTEQLSVTKKNAEDERHSSLHQIREELSVSKAMYERELEEARRDLSNSTQELTNLQRTFDKERVDSTSMRLEFGSLTKSVVDLKAENQTLHEEVKRTLERSQEKSRELEQRKAELADQEAQLRQIGLERERISNERHEDFRSLEEEAKRLKAQLLSTSRTLEESENRVISLERENHSLIMLNSREGRRSREELEKDKDMLSNENQRILRQYEEVNEQNSRLLGELSRLREKCSNMQVLQDRIEMYKRQLDSLEHQSEELQDAREAVSRAEGETDDLRRERDAMQARLDSLTDDSGALQKKELELDQCVEAADQQIRRLEQQMERASRYTASLPRSSGGVSPTSTFDVSPNKFY